MESSIRRYPGHQETTYKVFKQLWNFLDDLFEEFEMQVMPPIDEATPSKVRIDKVEKHMEIRRMNIEHLTELNKEYLEEHLLKPIRIITMTQDVSKIPTQFISINHKQHNKK
jgi:hypothetical protein